MIRYAEFLDYDVPDKNSFIFQFCIGIVQVIIKLFFFLLGMWNLFQVYKGIRQDSIFQ